MVQDHWNIMINIHVKEQQTTNGIATCYNQTKFL
jgi:hypothetical protein